MAMSGRKSIKIEAPIIITSDGTPVWMDKNWVVDFFDWLGKTKLTVSGMKHMNNKIQLTFTTPAMDVGSYDMVIINPIETEPVYRPSSTLVVPKYLPYVQILLPYAPKPVTYWPDGSVKVQNPAVLNDWYTEDFDEGGIPGETYWEALDIEVFANGRRLRKNPIEVYSVDEGQFSPDGDVYLEAEYAVNKNVGAYVRLTTPPQPNTATVEPGLTLAVFITAP